MLLGPGVGDNTPRRDGAPLQCPDKPLLPFLANTFVLYFRQCACHPVVGAVDVGVYRVPLAVFKSVFFVPDIQGSSLEFDVGSGAADGRALLGCWFQSLPLVRQNAPKCGCEACC